MAAEDEQTYMEGLGEFVAAKLNEGFSQEQIAEGLESTGVEYTEALAFVVEVADLVRQQKRQAGINHIVGGFLLGVVGAGVTVATTIWLPGGAYVVTVGLFIAAAYYLIKGISEVS